MLYCTFCEVYGIETHAVNKTSSLGIPNDVKITGGLASLSLWCRCSGVTRSRIWKQHIVTVAHFLSVKSIEKIHSGTKNFGFWPCSSAHIKKHITITNPPHLYRRQRQFGHTVSAKEHTSRLGLDLEGRHPRTPGSDSLECLLGKNNLHPWKIHEV